MIKRWKLGIRTEERYSEVGRGEEGERGRSTKGDKKEKKRKTNDRW